MDSSPLSLLVPRLEEGLRNSVVNGLTATTLDVCFDEVEVAVSTISILCGDEEHRVQRDNIVFRCDNIAFGVAIAPLSSSELSSSL